MYEGISIFDFKEALYAYMKKEGLSITELAKKIDRSRQTVQDWVRTGIKTDDIRQKIADQYPEIFNVGSSTVTKNVELPTPNILLLIKTEQARPMMQNLTALMIWFLFEASAKDRDHFRESLDEDWKKFLELTRAMTGETAFEITKSEGRLDWCMKMIEK